MKEKEQSFATKQEAQAVVFAQGSQGWRQRGLVGDKPSSSAWSFPWPLDLGVLGQNSELFWLWQGKHKTKPETERGKMKASLPKLLISFFPQSFCLYSIHPPGMVLYLKKETIATRSLKIPGSVAP